MKIILIKKSINSFSKLSLPLTLKQFNLCFNATGRLHLIKIRTFICSPVFDMYICFYCIRVVHLYLILYHQILVIQMLLWILWQKTGILSMHLSALLYNKVSTCTQKEKKGDVFTHALMNCMLLVILFPKFYPWCLSLIMVFQGSLFSAWKHSEPLLNWPCRTLSNIAIQIVFFFLRIPNKLSW